MAQRLPVLYNKKPCYDIVFQQSFDGLWEELAELGAADKRLCIVTDSTVDGLYAAQILKFLEGKCRKAVKYVFPAGEEHKNLDTVRDVYRFLIEEGFDRKDMLVALGGGVVGDLTGFAAATYLRGIDFIQVPTSLLAQVDSSIGGKTGVDFRAYKNMVGAFHQPRLVYMNTSTLSSLNTRLFNSGFGEILKHGLIKDASYFQWLKDNIEKIAALDSGYLEEMIYRSCEIKRKVVENDPTEKGERAQLNFGHTLGHAIEKQMNFELYHGECVVLGMIAALNICVERGTITKEEYDDIYNTFKAYNFPMTVDKTTIDEVIAASKNDKKMDGNKVKFILLKKVGEAYIDMTVDDNTMRRSLKNVVIE